MSHPARLLLRAPPHLPFVEGYPGIPANSSSGRKSAGVHGSLELRVGSQPVKAKWVRVEIRKYESLPPGFPGSSSSSNSSKNGGESTWEHIGDIQTLWKPLDSTKETDLIETADFKFYLPLPENIPSTIELPRSTGIRYELVAALCYKQKGGLFKKESYPILKISEPLNIIKHELHSTWPIYQQPSEIIKKFSNDQLILTVTRPNSAFGGINDKIQFIASLKSTKSQPIKLKGFECTIYEIITSIPIQPSSLERDGNYINQKNHNNSSSKKRKSLQNPISKSKPISTVKAVVDERIGLGGEKSAKIEMTIDRALVTIKNAKTIKVEYTLEVKAVMDGIKDKVEISGIEYTVGVFGRSTAEQAMREIGRVDALCPTIPKPPPPPPPIDPTPFTGSQPDLPPNARYINNDHNNLSSGPPPQRSTSATYQPIQQQQSDNQGYDPRQSYQRQSSSNSNSTFTTNNTNYNNFGMTPNQNRQYSTMPTSPTQRRPDVMFPTAQPLSGERPRSITPTSPTVESSGGVQDRYVQSDTGHDNSSRYSTATMATFGRWDKGLQNAMVSGQQGQGIVTSSAASDNAITPTTPTIPSPSIGHSSSATTIPSRPVSARPPGAGPPPPPSSFFFSAEQEKSAQRERYESARNLVESSQGQSSGPSKKTDDDEIPELPPPEYAPPRPAQPKRQYTAPSRPVSEYTSINGSPADSSPKTISSPRLASPPSGTGVNRIGSPSPTTISASQHAATTKDHNESRSIPSSPNKRSSIIQTIKSSPPLNQSELPNSSSSQGGSPIPYNAIYPPGRSSSISDQGTSATSTTTAAPGPIGLGISSHHSGLSEKEQMKRFYAAQDAVSRAQGPSQGLTTNLDQTSNTNTPNRSIDVGSSSQPSKTSGNQNVRNDNLQSPNNSPVQPRQSAYMSAAEEKEQMRKRFEEAQGRVNAAANRPEGSNSEVRNANQQPSNASPNRLRQTSYLSAAEEKEQMRKRFEEAQSKVNSAANRAEGGSNPNQALQPSQTSYPSAAEEKEQMRKRFEEATNRVQSASSTAEGGSSSAGNFIQQPPATASHIASRQSTYPTAAEEKEQMRRRFEDAQNRVARAQGQGVQSSPSAGLPGYDSVTSSASSPPSTSSRGFYNGYPSAVDEKDQMKRLFNEAQDRVTRASSQSPTTEKSGSGFSKVSSQTPGSSPLRSKANAAGYPNEKEQMRLFYEAQDRVAQASSGSNNVNGTPLRFANNNNASTSSQSDNRQISSSSPPPANILAPPVESPSVFEDQPQASSSSSSSRVNTTNPNNTSNGGYLSAEQEKDLMRKRYEQATSAVERYSSSSPPPPPPPSTLSVSGIFNTPPKNQIYDSPRTSLGVASEQAMSSKPVSSTTNPFFLNTTTPPKPSNNTGTATGAGTQKQDSSPNQRSISRNSTRTTTTTTTNNNISSPPDSPLLIRDPTIKAGKAKANSSANGSAPPPPPLPARPPKEYVELLSPVNE
ncbi:uncharacterized protein L201_006518 [Kwoniella dendrophila CBS 6074]|uniref:Arrestin C-terminal-like domain-containing protein n=1 Tax=Kwoniella dendrophila CBS 6074 TaxID=1295534 RepID=A0AAX4K3Z4_9TREE